MQIIKQVMFKGVVPLFLRSLKGYRHEILTVCEVFLASKENRRDKRNDEVIEICEPEPRKKVHFRITGQFRPQKVFLNQFFS